MRNINRKVYNKRPILIIDISEREALASKIKRMEIAHRLTGAVYNKRSASSEAKLRRYSTVIPPEAPYAAERLLINRKDPTEKLEAQTTIHTFNLSVDVLDYSDEILNKIPFFF